MSTPPKQGLRLYEIPDRLREIEAQIIEAEGEITPEIEAELDGLEEAFNRKAEYIALLSREAKAEAAAVKQEEDRLRARRTAAEKREKRLKDYLQACMIGADVERIEGERAKIRRQRNGRPSITWHGEPEDAPEEYRRLTVTVDTQQAYDDLRDGAELPDGFEVIWGEHVRVW